MSSAGSGAALALMTGADPTHQPTSGLIDRSPSGADPRRLVLCARSVVVRYGPRTALHGVDLELFPGEILGLLGPNGAGKTTLIRRLAGLLPSREGSSVELNGLDPATSKHARSRLGYLPEEPPLYPEETALRYVTYMASLAGIPRKRCRAAALEALERAGAEQLAGRLAGRLSKGQRQRVGFAAAIVHQPEVILLDEPTSGLDPAQMVKFRAILRELASSSAIIVSTHLLAEAQSVCERVVILDQGRVVAERNLGQPTSGTRLRVRVTGAPPADVECFLQTVPGVISVNGDFCNVARPEASQAIVAGILSQGWMLQELAVAADDLEEAFLKVVSGGSA